MFDKISVSCNLQTLDFCFCFANENRRKLPYVGNFSKISEKGPLSPKTGKNVTFVDSSV